MLLQTKPHFKIIIIVLSRKLFNIGILRVAQHLIWTVAFSSPPVKITAYQTDIPGKSVKWMDYRKPQREPALK